MTNLQNTFQDKGFVVIRNLFSDAEVERFKSELEKMSVGKKQKWTLPDGVCQHEPFWPVIFNEKILAAVRQIFGENIRFLQHNDLHVGFSSFSWHRDSVNRKHGVGGDWVETEAAYQLCRVGIYLQEADSGFQLGLIPGTHRPKLHYDAKQHQEIEKRTTSVSGLLAKITGKDRVKEHAEWITTSPGDAVIFDPRVLHTGSDFNGTKYSFFIAYGVENEHFTRHFSYYRHLRKDLNYQAFSPKLQAQLEQENLLPTLAAPVEAIEDAWIPSKAFTKVTKPFK